MANKNSVEDWFTENYAELFETKSINKVPYKYVKEKDANESYKKWRINNMSRLSLKSIHETVINNFKFEYKSMKNDGEVIKVYRMKTKDFDKLIKKLIPDDTVIEEFDAEEDEEDKDIELEKTEI